MCGNNYNFHFSVINKFYEKQRQERIYAHCKYILVFAQGLMAHAFEMYVHVIEMSPTAF